MFKQTLHFVNSMSPVVKHRPNNKGKEKLRQSWTLVTMTDSISHMQKHRRLIDLLYFRHSQSLCPPAERSVNTHF